MIMRSFDDNVLEIAHMALQDLDNYQHDYQKFLSYNDLKSMIEARMDRCSVNEQVWDLCVIDRYSENLLAPKDLKKPSSIDYFRVPWGTPSGSKMFYRIKNNLKKIIKHRNKILHKRGQQL